MLGGGVCKLRQPAMTTFLLLQQALDQGGVLKIYLNHRYIIGTILSTCMLEHTHVCCNPRLYSICIAI